MGVVEAIALSLGAIGKISDKIPNFPQRRKVEIDNLVQSYNLEIIKEQMDVARATVLQDKIEVKFKIFCEELKGGKNED